jgi:hypothetical protein
VTSGPLIPGMNEFDGPRRRVPRVVWWVVVAIAVVAALVVGAGLMGGVGPLRSLGLVTEDLQPVAYRPTVDERQIQIAVALPPRGLCPDEEVQVMAFERGPRVEVEAQVQRSRTSDCPVTGIVGDRLWADVALKAPLGDRQVIRVADRQPLPRESA